MSFGFLASALMLTLCTVAAVRPPSRPRWLATPMYVVGMTVNEMPIIWIALGVVSLAVSADRMSPSDPAGLAAGGLTLTAVGALVWSVVVAVRARGVPTSALNAALPAQWHADFATDLPAARVLRHVLLPFLPDRSGLAGVQHHRYGPDRRHRLQLVRGRDASPVAPVFVHFHGGRFRSGDAGRESLPLLRSMARRGWVCVSATYRLGEAGAFPASVVDAKRVVAWIREHADSLGIDRARLVVAGNSAGAHLAMFVALTPGDLSLQPGFETADTSVSAAVGLYGYYGPRSADPASSPAAHITSAAPPIFVLHGDRDSIAPVVWAREFVEKLRRVSVQPVLFAELPGAQHTFDMFPSVRAGTAAVAVERFCNWATGGVPAVAISRKGAT